MRRLRRIVEILTGRMDAALVDALAGQLHATKEGAKLAAAMAQGELSREQAHARMRDIEHEGDTQRAKLVEELADALVTPIDREDLFRFSRSIDDILDTLRDFVRESSLYRINDLAHFPKILAQALTGVQALEAAIRDLSGQAEAISLGALKAKKAGGAIRRMYQEEMARIFAQEISADAMKQRELLRRLEAVGMRIGEAADALADGAMKRWH